jgi:chromosome segregation ATPase
MDRGTFLLTVFVVATLGIWGCGQGNSSSQAERIRALEAKCAKLEDDYRTAATVRDQARKKTAGLEDERTQLQKDLEDKDKRLQLVTKERDELRQSVEARTTERDVLQTRCERLKRGLQNLLGQDDAVTPAAAPPVTTGPANLNGQS